MQRKPTRKWWGAYNALYGTQTDLPGVSDPPKKQSPKKPRKCPTERQEHFVASASLRKMGIIHHHSPNGGYRDVREAAAFKRMGTSPGYPDFQIPYARKGYHGLYIELKPLFGGVLSDHQKWWRDFLIAQGNCWYLAKGADDLVQFVENYMKC